MAVREMVNIRGLTRIKMRLSLNRLCNTKVTGAGVVINITSRLYTPFLPRPCLVTMGREWFVLKYLL